MKKEKEMLTLKPRNMFVLALIKSRKGHSVHGKTTKAIRNLNKRLLKKNINNED